MDKSILNAGVIAAAIGLLLVTGLLFLTRDATSMSSLHVLAETPSNISFECLRCRTTPQDIATAAQQHCGMFGKSAHKTRFTVEPVGDIRAAFACV